MRLKRINKRGPRGQKAELGDWSPVLWRYRVLLIIIAAVALVLGWFGLALVVVAGCLWLAVEVRGRRRKMSG